MFTFLRPKLALPDRQYMGNLSEALSYSPDMAELQRHTGQLLFVYDQMKRGGEKHNLLEGGSVFFGTYFTHDRYEVWHREATQTAIALESHSILARPAKIKGELYGIRPTRFLSLDRELENGYTFTRRRVTIDALCFEPRQVVVPVESWMYLGNIDYWNNRLKGHESLSPKPYNKRPIIGAYHHFETSE